MKLLIKYCNKVYALSYGKFQKVDLMLNIIRPIVVLMSQVMDEGRCDETFKCDV